MGTKAKIITTMVVFLFVMIITIGACAPEVYLPVLYEAQSFTLNNQDGQEVKLSDFRGEVVILSFIYTRCPDVCGELNYRLQSVWEQLKQELRQGVVLISVSFDSYDTPEVLKQYDELYNVPGWQFLTGTEEQIQQVTTDYGVAYEREADEWEIGHSIVIVLIDRNGMVRKSYGNPYFPEKDMIRELEYLLNQ
ncbi:MAG: SCO family protein [Dehalococcoidales bacterium]|jgi:protein SCO1/2|nr:SCO family protein [Dehalococcoidales bacterium]|tara:strand:+ start:7437 stop:8015 length:579 start_codon:yes stop_codon:yes gene_type:complete